MRVSGSESVTTVVITRNRPDDLLESLPRHRHPVIVIDNGSTDGGLDHVARTFADLEIVRLPCNHGAAARNLGVAMARTPYVAFADDDSWWAPDAFSVAARVLDEQPDIGLLAGRILVGADERTDPLSTAMASSPFAADRTRLAAVFGFAACGAIVRRDAFLAAGGFDPVIFFAGEEERLALDLATLGWRLCYAPEVVAHHYPSSRRAPRRRKAVQARNAVLTAVMRRSWRVVLRRGADALRDPTTAAGLLSAAHRMPHALAARRPVPAKLETDLRRLDRPGLTGPPQQT